MNRWQSALVGVALLSLPITSLPVLSRWLGGALVAPPASFLLAGLGVILFLQALWRRQPLPLAFAPLLVFVGISLSSTGLAFFRPLLPYKTHPYWKEALEAALTLGVGVSVWLAAALGPRRREDLVYWLRWLNWAGVLLVGWGLLQAGVIFLRHGQYPDWMVHVQSWFSVRDFMRSTFRKRVTALAYEPSWLAHMLNVLFFPYWLAATLTGFTACRRRWRWLTLERVLFLLGFLVLLASFSRIGLLGFFGMTGFLLLVLARNLGAWGQARFRQRWLGWALPLLSLALFFAGGVFLVWLLSLRDPRMAQIFNLSRFSNIYELGHRLKFGERVIYWALGIQVFALHPVLGAGLGSVGFYVPAYLPAYAWRLPEVRNALVLRDFVFNSKNLWVRLLAETGILGFAAFVVFLLVLFLQAWLLHRDENKLWRTLGWMGLLAVVALLGEGISLDSFAFPYFWLAFGLVTAGVRVRSAAGMEEKA